MTVAIKEKEEMLIPRIEIKNNRRLDVNHGIKGGKSGIDRVFQDGKFHGVIHGVAVMTAGNVKDSRGWKIDQITLDQIVAAGNAHDNLGLKSRFGHPNMSGNALGTFLGRAQNFYRDGDAARADLYISKTAYNTPEGDLASYVFGLAEKDPEAFGTSVVLGEYAWNLSSIRMDPSSRMGRVIICRRCSGFKLSWPWMWWMTLRPTIACLASSSMTASSCRPRPRSF